MPIYIDTEEIEIYELMAFVAMQYVWRLHGYEISNREPITLFDKLPTESVENFYELVKKLVFKTQ